MRYSVSRRSSRVPRHTPRPRSGRSHRDRGALAFLSEHPDKAFDLTDGSEVSWTVYAHQQTTAGSITIGAFEDMAIFSVFRHTLDQPIFTIAKRAGKPGRDPGHDPGRDEEFLVFSGRERLARAGRLAEALSIFQRKLKIVS